jgi:hypothetical protein
LQTTWDIADFNQLLHCCFCCMTTQQVDATRWQLFYVDSPVLSTGDTSGTLKAATAAAAAAGWQVGQQAPPSSASQRKAPGKIFPGSRLHCGNSMVHINGNAMP